MYALYCISVYVMAFLVNLYFHCPLEFSLAYNKLAVSTGGIHDAKQRRLSSWSVLCLRGVRRQADAENERTFVRIL